MLIIFSPSSKLQHNNNMFVKGFLTSQAEISFHSFKKSYETSLQVDFHTVMILTDLSSCPEGRKSVKIYGILQKMVSNAT